MSAGNLRISASVSVLTLEDTLCVVTSLACLVMYLIRYGMRRDDSRIK